MPRRDDIALCKRYNLEVMAGQPKLAIFDLDGTLIEFEDEYFYPEALKIISKLGFPKITKEDLREYWSHNNFFGFVPEEQRQEFAHTFHEIYDEDTLPPPRPFAGTVETLEHLLQHGIKIAIATARTSMAEELELSLHGSGLLKYISLVSTRGPQVRTWRDKTEQILSICTELQVLPTQSFMAGDAPVDIISAKQAQLSFSIALLSGGIREDVLKGTNPDLILEDVSHIRHHVPRKAF